MGAAQHNGVDPSLQQGAEVGLGGQAQLRGLQIPRLDQRHEGRTAHLQHLGGRLAGLDGTAVGATGGRSRCGQNPHPRARNLGGHAVDQAEHRDTSFGLRHIKG